MAFGIDDALVAATSAIKLTDTLVQTIERYRKQKKDIDIELLIEEARLATLKGLDTADEALTDFERTLIEKKIDLNKSLMQVIEQTSIWRPFEQYRLKRIQQQFRQFSESVYSASDDIAALARCRDYTGPMGEAVVESAHAKHQLNDKLNNAKSIAEAIKLLRQEMLRHKLALR